MNERLAIKMISINFIKVTDFFLDVAQTCYKVFRDNNNELSLHPYCLLIGDWLGEIYLVRNNETDFRSFTCGYTEFNMDERIWRSLIFNVWRPEIWLLPKTCPRCRRPLQEYS